MISIFVETKKNKYPTVKIWYLKLLIFLFLTLNGRFVLFYFIWSITHYRFTLLFLFISFDCTKIVICQIYICFSLLNENILFYCTCTRKIMKWSKIINKNILSRICFSSLMENGKWEFFLSSLVLFRRYDYY